ncbi:MAG TPA: serine hydrolase domain-containing protein [Segetibacter sp.]
MKYIIFLMSITCSFFFNVNAQTSPTPPRFISDSLNDYINQGMKDWNIPGLAIAIVKDGQTVMMKGFGVKDIKTNAPVDENTLFLIASNTKLFTGTALAQLEYNKKLSLDDKITKHLKGFALYDKNTTELVTIRDMLSHRIGTKTFQGDFTFWNGNISRQQTMNKMRFLKPTGIFRQDYGYCNSCFTTAGEIIPVVSKKPWEVYVYDSILMPLKMTNTHMLTQGISQRPNVAKPYTTQFTGTLKELPYDNIYNLGPAGSMVSNVKDMVKWLTMQLDSGRYEGKRILPWSVIQKTRDMNVSTGSRKSSVYPVHFRGYGLGVFMSDYNGRQIYYHTGGAFGFVTNTCFVPEEKLAITILTNNDNQNFFEALRYQILDAYLGVPYVNRSKAQLSDFNKGMTKSLDSINTWKQRVGNKPPKSIDAFTGDYVNEIYGPIVIQKDKTGNKLNINFKGHNNLTATLEYMDNNEWLMTYSNIAYGIFPTKFKIENNKVISVDIKANDFVEYDSYIFQKK